MRAWQWTLPGCIDFGLPVGNYSPKDIADFLHQLPHLDPKMVGRVLGEPDELALSVLQEYANGKETRRAVSALSTASTVSFMGDGYLLGFVFKDFSFDVALRIYLGRFVLPGEAQKIDRILQAFAKAYHAANPRDKICTSEDAVYTLAFSVVLLNTDAHNPHLARKYKMGKDDFLRNHQRLLVDGKHMPHEYLGQLYDSFASYPIQLLPRKPTALLRDELELTFAEGPLGLDIETSIDARTCVVKKYALPHRHIYCSFGGSPRNSAETSRPVPDLAGYVIVAVADDCTRAIGYALTRYLLKTAARPVTIRFCEPSVYFESMAS
jgi:hypothetical protein